jgi:subtilisin family serine protease
MIIVLDLSVGAVASIEPEGGFDDVLSELHADELHTLMCGLDPCSLKDRSPTHSPPDAGPPVQEFGWWQVFWSDADSNGMDDRLQSVLVGQRESVSKTAITGDDGRLTVAIIVHYAWHPGPTDIAALIDAISAHGWESEGSWFMPMGHLDAIVLDHVPVSALIDVWGLDGVILVEEQNVIVPYLDKATRGSKVRTSGLYDETLRGLGYTGSGIVIAVVDTGVDNEHFSLDDFSDNNHDNTKDPDELSDPKWVAGCDATGIGQSGCNPEDPDDGDGHGTHVGGIALGTGDWTRTNQGYAPGSYLVDVKVMEDYGGGNSQSILAGLQWIINNHETDWGNNESSRGIEVVSMSFGRQSSPGSDNSDDGSSAEAQLVNQASEAGLVCVAAIGNDGENYVNSVGAADTAITVGWLDDKNSVDRSDDTISSSSNYGPREDDGDGDSYDELKPWVVAPGSNINSAKHGESSSILPGSDNNRASDDYVQKSGSSMSTPAVSGMVAVMLEIGEVQRLDFFEDGKGVWRSEAIRDYLMRYSESRGGTTEEHEGESWNDRYGFGIIDGGMIASGMLGAEQNDSGGGPVPPLAGHWVEIENPTDQSWVVQGQTYNIRGHINEHGEDNGSIEEVLVKIEYSFRPGPSDPISVTTLVDWDNPIGITNWTVPLSVPYFPEDYTDLSIIAKVSARNDIGRWSNLTDFEYRIGIVNMTLNSPSGQDSLSGVVSVSGQLESIDSATIQWRLGTEDWEDAATYSGNREFESEWSFNWDTTSVKDGEYRLSVRLDSGVGVVTEEIRRSVTIDNVPPTPDLVFVSKSISVQEFGIPMSEAFMNTFLEVRATVRNTGDMAANEVGIILEEDGSRKDEYVVPNIDSGDFIDVVLYWNPSSSGEPSITIIIDPLNTIEELDDSNNRLSASFPVLPRPEGVDLAIREGAIVTTPVVPRPFEQILVEARVDNLGASDAVGVGGSLEILTGRGWEQVSTASAAFVLGGSYALLQFLYTPNQTGPQDLRINVILDGATDLDWTNNVHQKTILVDRTTLTGPREAEFNVGETPIEIINLDDEEGGLVITEKERMLYLYKLTPNKALVACSNIMEDRWSGDIVVRSTEDGIAHILWTRRYLDSNGFLMQTLSYSTIDSTCRMTPIQDLLKGIPLSDGKYWGIDMDVSDSEIIVAGYHRDLFTGGTMGDITNIFLLHADAPTSSSDWDLSPSIIAGIDIPQSASDPLAIEFGHERAHLLYQTTRNDTTGKERLGLWYAHGLIEQSPWSYKKAVGDEASLPHMTVIVEDKEERIVALWREGEGQDSELLAIVADSTFESQDDLRARLPARGLGGIGIVGTTRGIQVLYDHVGPFGPQVEYGIIDHEDGWIGLSNRILSGQIDVIDRSPERGETVMLLSSSSGWQIRSLVDDGGGSKKGQTIIEQVRSSLGLDEDSFEILVIGVAFAVLILGAVALVSLSAQGLRWLGRRRAIEDDGAVLMEDDVVDLIDDSDLSISSEDVELVRPPEPGQDSIGAEGRRARRERRSESEPISDAPALEDVGTKPLPELPAKMRGPSSALVSRPAVCSNCGGRFVASTKLSSTRCPICEERVPL